MPQWQSQLQNSLWEAGSIRVRYKNIYIVVHCVRELVRTCHVVATSHYKLPNQKKQKLTTYIYVYATDFYFSVASLYNHMFKGSLGVREVCCYPLAAYWRLFDCCDSSHGAAVVFLLLWSCVPLCSICSMSHGRAECDNRPSVFPCLTSSEEDFSMCAITQLFYLIFIFFSYCFCKLRKDGGWSECIYHYNVTKGITAIPTLPSIRFAKCYSNTNTYFYIQQCQFYQKKTWTLKPIF